VVRRDSFRTVIRTLFVLQGRGAERSTIWRRGREAESKGCSAAIRGKERGVNEWCSALSFGTWAVVAVRTVGLL
jgi:hypothetical protein